VKFNVALASVNGKGALQFLSRSRRHRTFFDDKFADFASSATSRATWSMALKSPLHRSAKVGVPTQMKNGVAKCNGVGGIGANFKRTFFAHLGNNLFETRLVDGQAPDSSVLISRRRCRCTSLRGRFLQAGPGTRPTYPVPMTVIFNEFPLFLE